MKKALYSTLLGHCRCLLRYLYTFIFYLHTKFVSMTTVWMPDIFVSWPTFKLITYKMHASQTDHLLRCRSFLPSFHLTWTLRQMTLKWRLPEFRVRVRSIFFLVLPSGGCWRPTRHSPLHSYFAVISRYKIRKSSKCLVILNATAIECLCITLEYLTLW